MATSALNAVRLQLAAQEPELRRRGVRHLAVFGSVARGEDRSDRDVDLAVEIEAGHSFSLIRTEETGFEIGWPPDQRSTTAGAVM